MRHLLSVLLLTACSSPPVDDRASEGALYRIDVGFDSEPPTAGEIGIVIDVFDTADQPVPGCDLTATAVMPEHGHGGMNEPELIAADAGRYDLAWTCTMAGHWELTFDLACPGGDDQVVVDVDVD
jgi:hypothetical protein